MIDPPAGFTLLESSGFTPDGNGIVYSYVDLSLTREGRATRGDIYTSDLDGGNLTRLTHTPSQHDENATFSPSGAAIAWNHPVGFGLAGQPGHGEEIYLMRTSGGDPTRLTRFADPDALEFDPDARQISEISWNPTGDAFVFGHASRETPGGLELGAAIWTLRIR